jgi:SAM-dependent methyltransferase
MSGTEHWRHVASLDDVAVRDAILSGYRDGKPFAPYIPTIDVGSGARVLDFGCGLGRNFPYLITIAQQVVGYDVVEMIQRARAQPSQPAVALEDDWAAVREQRFDLVFASLVFQHIEPAQLERYLDDIFVIARRCYVLSRGRHDFGGPTMQYLRGRVALPDGVLVEHDPRTNGLTRVGSVSGAEIAELDDDRHFEIVIDV